MTKILVIEDQESVRLNLVEMLEAEDYDVVGAQNGMIGALWALDHLPDLIICDVMMPELDGYGVIATLRHDPATTTIPFIFLTAKADKSDLRQGMELGADDYLTKPFTRAELLGAIAMRFTKQEAITQQYTAEHQRAEALQQKVEELHQVAGAQDELVNKFQQDLRDALPKLNMAILILKNIPAGVNRDRCLKTLQEACNHEISVLNQLSHLQDSLTPQSVKLLRQYNLLSSRTSG